jgi:uncharacterized membrane protein YraQ (UPF0718 family)
MNNKTKQNSNMSQDKKPGKGLKLFWLSVVVMYLGAFLGNSDLAWSGLQATGQTLVKILPIMLLIFGIMILSNLFLTPERIKKHVGQEAGWRGWLYAIIFGILVAGPPYALYPMLKQMKEHGLKTNYLAAFLYNRNIKIPFIPVMIYYFGWQYTTVITILVIVFSIISGLMMEKLMGGNA